MTSRRRSTDSIALNRVRPRDQWGQWAKSNGGRRKTLACPSPYGCIPEQKCDTFRMWKRGMDEWNVELRCPVCGASGAAEVSDAADCDHPLKAPGGALRVERLPDGFRVVYKGG